MYKIEKIITYNKLLNYVEQNQVEKGNLNLEKKVLGIISHHGPYGNLQKGYIGVHTISRLNGVMEISLWNHSV